jgi:tetratricopeptide (TPR) repeat protein
LLDEVEDLVGGAGINAHIAGLEAMAGDFERALSLLDESQGMFEQLGQRAIVARTSLPIRSYVHSLANDPVSAEGSLRESCALLERMRERNALSTQAAELADVIYQQGRYAEAERWTRLGEANAVNEDNGAQASWRSVRAKVLARRGSPGDAESLALEAVVLADRTDELNRRARVRLDLADVLRLDSRIDDAAHAAHAAAGLFGQKGNVAGSERARTLTGAEVRA